MRKEERGGGRAGKERKGRTFGELIIWVIVLKKKDGRILNL